MKTVQDLVYTLNENFDNEFDLFDKENGFEFCLRVDGAPIIDFNSRDKSFEFQSYIEYVYGRSLNMIVNFLANSNPEDWFPKKRYNIVIGIDTNTDFKTAYRKTATKGVYEVNGSTELNDLRKNRYIFTDEEIKNLKVTLPPDLSKIVDLGKVEVKDEIA